MVKEKEKGKNKIVMVNYHLKENLNGEINEMEK